MSLVGSLDTISAAEALIAIAVFCLVSIAIKSLRKPVPRGLKSLPGPWGYPFIGNMLDLGQNPHLSLTQMSQKYGDVMKIRIGMRPVVVLSGLETIKQALVRQGGDFMGRPDLFSSHLVSGGNSLAFGTDSGPVWQMRRKLAQSALKSFAASPSPDSSSTCLLEEHVSKEASYLVMKLQQVMLEKKSLDPYRYLVVSVANVICAICFGKRYSHDDEELLSIVNVSEEFVEFASSGNPADYIPALQYLPSNNVQKFKAINRRFTTFLQKIIQEHYESFSKDSIRDITDSLIDQSQENTKLQISSEKIVNLVNDIFGAEIQKKIQEEIDESIGQERKPGLSDRLLMPYTEAFILEVFRHSSFLPFTIPHCTTKDTILNGYYIPKDVCVFVNQWQVNHDETLWESPSSFKPERFLTANGKGINRDESEKVLAFGLGKRRCIGEPLARWQVFLFLVTLLQQLQFSVPDGVKVDMTPRYGLSMKHKRCEHFQVKRRFPQRSHE
ncbi:cytochrome P450 1A5-like isoform X2 [Zootoca vivipara]|uniref:cytochrome P450 1A5-like isoform X2 n=1 Tax=Zootoca vivipara TaxID=8524 RepID=UPI00293BD587|nr:cytochrome P450 1A5-like isoform X2 [Zootoca vivipara]